jgi:esterase
MRLTRRIFPHLASLLMFVMPVQAAPKWPLPQGVKSVEVNSYDMAYQETGSGVPLVLVHGAINDYRGWAAQVPEFAKNYRVIAVSLRHYYPERWDGKGNDFSIGQHISDLPVFIRQLNVGPVHLLGHSRGGAVVLNAAKMHPELIKSLILEDASGLEALLPKSPDNDRLVAEAKANREALAHALAAGEIEAGVQRYIEALNGAGSWSKLAADRKQMLFDNIGTALIPEGRPVTTCAEISKFSFPILLLNGERSPKRYGAMYQAMRKCKDIPEPVVIPNAAHAMHRDNPAAFNAAVLSFLARQ